MTEQQKIKLLERIDEISITWFETLFDTEAMAEMRHLHRVLDDRATRKHYETHRQLVRDIAGRGQ